MKKAILRICFGLFLLAVYACSLRGGCVTSYKWKHTTINGGIGSGMLYFGKNSNYSYQWPLIRRDGESVGVILLCCYKWMAVYSLEDKRLGVYQYFDE
jgi:hypothetical protein